MSDSIKHLLFVLLACLPMSAQAHKAWLLPSQTVHSSNGWVTVDAAVSNDLFYFNHVPLNLANLVITAPDGSTAKADNAATSKFRSVFDLQLVMDGTWRIAVVSQGLFASFEDAKGEKKRWRGAEAELATAIPADATNVKVTESSGRVETFVSAGKPDLVALKPTGSGLELVAVTHPNDLFAGESATFRFLIDGRPASDLEVEVIPGGIRYRDKQNEITTRTDAAGSFSVRWPQAGMYWLNASLQDSKTSNSKASERRASYSGTFEVLPQ